ncbi:MAG TPA: sialidase family protein [Actinomycetota bacterium]|nr:sialidase family protein [Actinomycetota bacterium]
MEWARACRGALIGGLACLVVLGAAGGGALRPPAASAARTARSVAHRAGGRAVPAPALPDVVTTQIGHAASEPTLGVASNGDVFYAAADIITTGNPLPPIDVLRSADGGRSWDVVSPRAAGANVHFSTGDPYVYVDRTDEGSRVFTVDLQGFMCSLLSFSDNGGESWTTNPLGCGRPVNDHQTVFAGPPVESVTTLYPKIVYYCYQDVVSSTCSKSLDGGVTFVPTGGLSFSGMDEDGTICGGLHGHGFGGPDGTVYIPKGHCGFPWLAISKDEGATWTRVQVAELGSADHEASVAADGNGNVYYAYIGSNKLPYLVVSRDGGLTWGKPLMVGRPGVVETSLPSIDVGESGLVAFGYMGTQDRPEEGRYDEVEWDGYVTTTRTALSRRPVFFSSSVNEPGDPLLRGECPQTKCGPVYDFIDVVVAPDDTVWGAFVDGCLAACAAAGIGPNDGSEGLATHITVPR